MKKYKLIGAGSADSYGGIPLKKEYSIYEGDFLEIKGNFCVIMKRTKHGLPDIVVAVPSSSGFIIVEAKPEYN